MDKFDVPKISVNGVILNDTHENLYGSLGKCCEIEDNGDVNYHDVGSKRQYRFLSDAMGEDKLVTVIIIINP